MCTKTIKFWKSMENTKFRMAATTWGGREEDRIRESYIGNFNRIYSFKRYFRKSQAYTKVEKTVKCTPTYLVPSFNNLQIISKHFASRISSIFLPHTSI